MYVTTKKITVDGVCYAAGDELPLMSVDPGCLESMLRQGQAVLAPPPGSLGAPSQDDAEADLEKLNKAQLAALATSRKLPVTGKETKADLLALLKPAPASAPESPPAA